MANPKGELLIEFGPVAQLLRHVAEGYPKYGAEIQRQAISCLSREAGLEEYLLLPWVADCEHLAECFDDLAKAARHTLAALERLELKYPGEEA